MLSAVIISVSIYWIMQIGTIKKADKYAKLIKTISFVYYQISHTLIVFDLGTFRTSCCCC